MHGHDFLLILAFVLFVVAAILALLAPRIELHLSIALIAGGLASWVLAGVVT